MTKARINDFDFGRAARSLDERLFGYVPTETSIADRRSLMAIYNATYDTYGPFEYLEIGSHLGGSLQVLLADQRCTRITSIDSRPLWVPDERRDPIPYPENSTERMLRYLEFVPGGNLDKLRTIEASVEDIEQGVGRPRLCLIDGEHTVEAALRDARFCRAAIQDDGVIVFHDRHLVRPAIDTLVTDVGECESYPLPSALFVIGCGRARFLYSIQEMLAPFLERFAKAVAARQ